MRVLGLVVLFLAAREPDVEGQKGVFRRLRPPQPGEWRWLFPEEGQTFAEYKDSGPARPTAEQRVIYLVPFLTRPAEEGLLEGIARVLAASYGREVKTLPPGPLPSGVYDRARRQVSALALVPHLVRALPKDGLFLLAVTDRDLFVGELSHAFGWGSLKHRVGILSTRRLEAEDNPALRRRRLLTLALHESGHLLSLPHCTFYQCLMNGALDLKEADARPAALCPVCRSKLCWNLGADPLERERALAAAYEALGLFEDARAALTIVATTG